MCHVTLYHRSQESLIEAVNRAMFVILGRSGAIVVNNVVNGTKKLTQLTTISLHLTN